MTYVVTLEKWRDNYAEIEPLYREHYAQMQARLEAKGLNVSPYKPRLESYFAASDGGWLLNYIVRDDGAPVGYSNVYLTNDMHNGDFIAREDTIYITPAHRNGLGRKLTKFVLADLKQRGVKRADVTTATDDRVGLLCRRLGFKPVSEVLRYEF